MSEIPRLWRALYAELNGVQLDTRDPDHPCEDWERDDTPDGSGQCETDGHYMCGECRHITLAVLRRRRSQCEDCGAKLDFSYSQDGDCPNRCDVPYNLR